MANLIKGLLAKGSPFDATKRIVRPTGEVRYIRCVGAVENAGSCAIGAAGQIDAWFWGHEHLCAVHDSYKNVRYPVLIGNGGFPEKLKSLRKNAPPLKHNWTHTDNSGYLLFGFAVLDFDDDKIEMQLVYENGKAQFGQVIS